MGQNGTQTIATFTGTLLKREQSPDNKLIQLIFREGDKNWLCISTNLADTAWRIGETYKIQGVYKHVGERPYIYQPTIVAIKKRRKLTFNRVLVASVGVAVIAIVFGAYAILKPSNSGQALGASTNHPSETVVTKDDSTDVSVTHADTQSSPTPQSTPTSTPTSSVTPTTKPANSNTPSPSPATPPPVTPTPVVTPPTAPDCEAPTLLAFAHLTQPADEAHPVGTVIQVGVDGEQQTCYPDGRSSAGVTTVTKPPVDEIITV